MPKPLIAIAIRRSRLATGAEAILGVSLVAYAAIWSSTGWSVIIALAVLLRLIGCLRATSRVDYLRCRLEGELAVWERSHDGRHWTPTACRARRLGPWVTAVALSGQVLWLWPDSSENDSLRHLREALLDQAAA
ncbi:hypothetical protein [Salinicola avicenniae]|uniref:hypothetical protein n=1 Tax=Salinicola avicenniae TaxID=2916836 RepID=UPI002072A8B8|nr:MULTISPECIES: hypothetical protein [unclassified Salinicola]